MRKIVKIIICIILIIGVVVGLAALGHALIA